MRKVWFNLFLLVTLLFPVGYFIFKTVTTPAPLPLLQLDPYQRLLSVLKMTAPAIASCFAAGERPVTTLAYSFFEPPVLATSLALLLLLVLGLFIKKGGSLLYTGVLWFLLTLSPLIYQPDYGQISLLAPPYLSCVGLFLVLCVLVKKLVS